MPMVARNFTRRLHATPGCRFYCSFLPTQGGTSRTDSSSHIYATTDFCDYKGMQLCFLGTSSSIPTLTRNTSCLALRLDKVTYLFDCGEGVQKQLYRTQFRFGSIGSIFITHMHGDHVFGLPGLLSGLGMTTNRSESINIYGPEGLRMYVRNSLNGCYGRVSSKYAVHELKTGKKPKTGRKRTLEAERHEDELVGQDLYASSAGIWDLFEDDQYIVKAGLLQHSIPCWGYIVEERARPGRFNVERARELRIRPGRDYALLQQGHSITSDNGQKINPSDVLGHSRRGRKIVILGDTYDSSSLLMAAKGADVLVHECTVLEEEGVEAVKRHHSTATMAGNFARAIGARCLVLTHFSCKFEGRLDRIQESVRAAQIAFGNKKVIAAKDFLGITVCQTDEPS